jgi:hypothetical protein
VPGGRGGFSRRRNPDVARRSIGLQDKEDIIADVAHALAAKRCAEKIEVYAALITQEARPFVGLLRAFRGLLIGERA